LAAHQDCGRYRPFPCAEVAVIPADLHPQTAAKFHDQPTKINIYTKVSLFELSVEEGIETAVFNE